MLSIGVSSYRDSKLRLPYAAADAQAFAESLKRQEHGPLYDVVHTTVLLDREASREAILEAMESFLGAASPIDVAVLFLAGHGVRTERPTAYYFLTENASPSAPHIAGVDMQEINRQLLRLHRNIPSLVVVLDTCHAGAVAGTEPVQFGADLSYGLAAGEGLYILTAASPGQQSYELAREQHGAFTYALLDGLAGAAADPDGLITVSGLWSHASHLVPRLTNDRQRPYISIVGEDLTLAAHPDRGLAVTPRPVTHHNSEPEAPKQRDRVAIRDFEYFGPDADYQWMHRALSQDVLTAFSELRQLDVYDENMLRFVTRDTPDVLEAAQRAGVKLLVQGAYWVQNHQLSINAQVQSVRPLQLIASARTQGPVDQFSQLTSELMMKLFDQLPVDVPPTLLDQLRKPASANLDARRLLAESEGADGGSVPAPSRGADAMMPPDAWHWTLDNLFAALDSLTTTMISPARAQAAGGYEAELQQTLEAYRQALQRKDLVALRAFYEEFSPSQQSALERYFDNAENLHVELDDVRVALIGDSAAVAFTRRDRFDDRTRGEPQDVAIRITKRFRRGGEGQWRISKEQ